MKEVTPIVNTSAQEERDNFLAQLETFFDPISEKRIIDGYSTLRTLDLPLGPGDEGLEKELAVWCKKDKRSGESEGYCLQVLTKYESRVDLDGGAVISQDPEVVKKVALAIFDARASGNAERVSELETGGGWKDLAQAA